MFHTCCKLKAICRNREDFLVVRNQCLASGPSKLRAACEKPCDRVEFHEIHHLNTFRRATSNAHGVLPWLCLMRWLSFKTQCLHCVSFPIQFGLSPSPLCNLCCSLWEIHPFFLQLSHMFDPEHVECRLQIRQSCADLTRAHLFVMISHHSWV